MEMAQDYITFTFSMLVVATFVALIYFAIWQVMMKIGRSRCKKWDDDKLNNVYQSTSSRQRWVIAIIFFVFTGPFISIFLFFALKNMHFMYEAELIRRKINFTQIY